MSERTLHYLVSIPGIPAGMTDETVLGWLKEEVSHPHDAYYEASVTVVPVPHNALIGSVLRENPERDGNGCMIYQQPAEEGK